MRFLWGLVVDEVGKFGWRVSKFRVEVMFLRDGIELVVIEQVEVLLVWRLEVQWDEVGWNCGINRVIVIILWIIIIYLLLGVVIGY